jgi:DNA-binding Lrp family transcriptional regulator
LGSKPDAVYVEKNKINIKFDKLDIKILKLLASKARMSFIDIAAKLKTTAKIVAYRVRKLEKQKIILKYRTKINYSAHEDGYGGWIHWKTSGAHFYSYHENPSLFTVDCYAS